MPKLCKFKDVSSETDIYVNPLLVKRVRTNFDYGSLIEFDGEDRVAVKGTMAEVSAALNDGLK